MIDIEIYPISELDPTRIDFVVATAVLVERDAVLNRMVPLSGKERVLQVPWDESTYFLGLFGIYNCALVLGESGGDGRDGSHQVIGDAIARWKPRAIIMPGIAFGVGSPQCMGDVLVSTKVCPYDLKKVTPELTIQRGPIPEAGQVLLNRLRNAFWSWQPETGPRRPALFGPLLSGNTLVNDPAFKAELLRMYPEAIGGEMEGAGLYGAAERKKVEWVIIKGICDWGENKKDDYQSLAAANAVDLAYTLLNQPGLDEASFHREAAPREASGVEQATRSLNFSQVQAEIRSTHAGVQQALERLNSFTQNNLVIRGNRKTLPKGLKPQADLLTAGLKAATEMWLNAYNDGAARFLSGNLDREQFLRTFGEEILQIFRNTSTPKEILQKNVKAYGALYDVHAEVVRASLSPSAKRLLGEFGQRKVGAGGVLTFQLLEHAMRKWSKPDSEGFSDAVTHLVANGVIKDEKSAGLVLTELGVKIASECVLEPDPTAG